MGKKLTNLKMKELIIVKLQGGLGNQMFQYAIGKLLAEKKKAALFFDLSFFEDQEKRPGFTPRQFELGVFNPQFQIAEQATVQSFLQPVKNKRLRRFFGLPVTTYYREDVCRFDASVLSLQPPLYLDGYFQSEQYYAGNDEMIHRLFTFPATHAGHHNQLIQAIENTNAVAVHFRRGDYVSDAVTGSFHGICSLDYYRQAFQLIEAKVPDPHFYIFSDDINWVEQQVTGWASNITFVKGNNEAPGWVDMMLMSKCRHHIIANSSFSWWGAWLNKKAGKQVIAPLKWFNDVSINTKALVPETWMRI